MRVALVTDGITPYVMGGMQKHSTNVARALAQRGVHVDLYHILPTGEHNSPFTTKEAANITEHTFEFPEQDPFPGHYLRASYKYSERIWKVLQENLDVDVIYAKGFSGWKMLKEKMKGRPLPPVVVNFHGMNMFQRSANLSFYLKALMLRPAVRFNMNAADHVVSYGGGITHIIEQAGVPRGKILEIPGSIDASWLEGSAPGGSGRRRFAFIGRYDRMKGIEELQSVIPAFKENCEFVLVGPIPSRKKLRQDNVTYTGTVQGMDHLIPILDKTDVLICPSWSEGMPNVILEAMARHCAIIATDVGAVAATTSKENGWLIKPGSRNELSNAIREAVSISPDALQSMQQSSFQLVQEQFIFNKVGDLLHETLKNIIQA